MLKTLKQARSVMSLLNPEEILTRARRPLHIGLVASSPAAYAEMEEYLLPPSLPLEDRTYRMDHVHRVGDPGVPEAVDLILFEEGIPATKGTYTFQRANPAATVTEILRANEDIDLALARQFPAFRGPAVERTIHAIARENALFAISHRLARCFAQSDRTPLGFWRVCLGHHVPYRQPDSHGISHRRRLRKRGGLRRTEGRHYLHRRGRVRLACARPRTGRQDPARRRRLIPKGAIAYAGTYAVGKGLELFYSGNTAFTREQKKHVYREALDRGRHVAGAVAKESMSGLAHEPGVQ